jgi:hypothetical protein
VHLWRRDTVDVAVEMHLAPTFVHSFQVLPCTYNGFDCAWRCRIDFTPFKHCTSSTGQANPAADILHAQFGVRFGCGMSRTTACWLVSHIGVETLLLYRPD